MTADMSLGKNASGREQKNIENTERKNIINPELYTQGK